MKQINKNIDYKIGKTCLMLIDLSKIKVIIMSYSLITKNLNNFSFKMNTIIEIANDSPVIRRRRD